jgi:hypothetical protein
MFEKHLNKYTTAKILSQIFLKGFLVIETLDPPLYF